MSGYSSSTSPYAAIGNGRVHYSAASALPLTLLSTSRHPRRRDVGAYTPDALPTTLCDRRDLLTSPSTPGTDHSGPVQLPRSRLQFIRTLGHGLLGDVSTGSTEDQTEINNNVFVSLILIFHVYFIQPNIATGTNDDGDVVGSFIHSLY